MTEISGGYVNHIGSTVDGAGNLFAVITQDGPADGDLDVIIERCLATANPELAASWVEVARFTERVDGKHGYGTGEVRRNGDFVAVLSERNAANKTVSRVHVIPGIAAPWPVATPGSGVDPATLARIASLEQQVRTLQQLAGIHETRLDNISKAAAG